MEKSDGICFCGKSIVIIMIMVRSIVSMNYVIGGESIFMRLPLEIKSTISDSISSHHKLHQYHSKWNKPE